MKEMIPEDLVPCCIRAHCYDPNGAHRGPDALYTVREREDLIKSARNWKHKRAVEKAFHLLKEGDTILDYGCGSHRSLVKQLRAQDYVTDGHDLCFDLYTPWMDNNKRPYDVVIASNVLNVQPDDPRQRAVLTEIGRIAQRLIIFNYPASPRKLYCPTEWLHEMAMEQLPDWDLEHTNYGSGWLTVATKKEN